MALNFPVTPTTGAVYTAEDQSWIWDGQVWLAQSDGMSVEGSDARYLKLTGGTLTGVLTVLRSTPDTWSALTLQRPTGTNGGGAVKFTDAVGKDRWTLLHGGMGGGEDLRLYRYDAAGVLQSTPLTLKADGNINVSGPLNLVAASAVGTSLNLNKFNASQISAIRFQDVGDKTRWSLVHQITSDSTLTFNRFDAAGAFLNSPLVLWGVGGMSLNGYTTLRADKAGTTSLAFFKFSAANESALAFNTFDDVRRWQLTHRDDANNSFLLRRYDAAGAMVDEPISVSSVTGDVTFSGALLLNSINGATVTSLTPSITFVETDAAAEMSRWRIRASTGTLYISTASDAGSTQAGGLLFIRTTAGVVDVRLQGNPLSSVATDSLVTVGRGDARYAPKALFDDLVNAVADLRAILAAQVGRINQLEAQVD